MYTTNLLVFSILRIDTMISLALNQIYQSLNTINQLSSHMYYQITLCVRFHDRKTNWEFPMEFPL